MNSNETTEPTEDPMEDSTKRKLLERIEVLCETETDPEKIAKVWLMLEVPQSIHGIMEQIAPGAFAQGLSRMMPGGIPPIQEGPYGQHHGAEADIEGRVEMHITGVITEDEVTIEYLDAYRSLDIMQQGALDGPPPSLDTKSMHKVLISALDHINESEDAPPES